MGTDKRLNCDEYGRLTHPMLKGIEEIAWFYRVPPKVILFWIKQYALPVCEVPESKDIMLPAYDAYKWLRAWRPREYLVRTGQIKPPPEAQEIIGRITRDETDLDKLRTVKHTKQVVTRKVTKGKGRG